VAAAVAARLGITEHQAAMLPADKLGWVQAAQAQARGGERGGWVGRPSRRIV
jgi:cation transport ATPase